jgi:hypothetical protein
MAYVSRDGPAILEARKRTIGAILVLLLGLFGLPSWHAAWRR